MAAFAGAVASLAWFVVLPEVTGSRETKPESAPLVQTTLPPPWEIRVDVFNGTDVANAAALLANEIGGPLAYRIRTVENGAPLDYVHDARLLPTGSSGVAAGLARALGVQMTALRRGRTRTG